MSAAAPSADAKLAPAVSPGRPGRERWRGWSAACSWRRSSAPGLPPLFGVDAGPRPALRHRAPCCRWLGRWATSQNRCSSARPGSRTRASCMPGHGGVLDRLDSLYFVMPVDGGAVQSLRGDLVRNGERRGVAVLGSTGSIGRSTLDVLRRQRDHFRVVALTCGRNRGEFERQLAAWRPAFAGLAVPGSGDAMAFRARGAGRGGDQAGRGHRGERGGGRCRARRDPGGAPGGEAGGAGQQGEPGDGRRPGGAGRVRGRRRDRPGGLGAQRGAAVRHRTRFGDWAG